jgi:hypothetical protein
MESEFITQITFGDGWYVALTNKGNLFKRYGVDDVAGSFWEAVDLPDFSKEIVIKRKTEPLEDRKNRMYGR